MSLCDGLLAYWPLDETTGTTYTEQVNGINLLAHGAATVANRTVAGKLGAALADSNGEFYSEVGNNGIEGTTAMTVSFWTKLYGFAGNHSLTIQNTKGGRQGPAGWVATIAIEGWLWGDPPTFLRYGIFFSPAGYPDTDPNPPSPFTRNDWCVFAPASGLVGDYIWRLVVITFDNAAAPMGRIYVDNSDVSFLNRDAYISALDDEVKVIVTPFIADSEAHSAVDEISVWNRVLTSAERTELWNAGHGKSLVYCALGPKTLTISAGAHGSITAPASSPVSCDYGSVVTITALPDAHCHFTGWTGDTGNIADVNSASTTITMNADATIVATFARDSYVFVYSAGPHGHLTGSTVQTINYGDYGMEVSAFADEVDYVFSSWSDGVLTFNRTDQATDHNITVTAYFSYIGITGTITQGVNPWWFF